MFAYFRKTIQSINSFIYASRSALLSCLLIFIITLPLVYYLAISMATVVAVTVMMISMLAVLAFAHRTKSSAEKLVSVNIMLANLKQAIQSMPSVIYSGWIKLVRIIIPFPIYDADSATLTFSSNTRTIMLIMIYPYQKVVEAIIIPNSVTEIGSRAFFNCTSLTNITIPNNVTSIGFGAFLGCTSLKSIIIPGSVTSIGFSAFMNCNSLTSITIPDSATKIGDMAFHGCSGLTEIVIPNGVTSIGFGAFFACTSLKSIIIPGSVTSIGFSAFMNCNSLTSITIPNSVTSIGFSAFMNCNSLTSITIPNSVTKIGKRAFHGCYSLNAITIPNGVRSIGVYAFMDCPKLEYIIVPERLKNQTADFWKVRGVDVSRTAIYGMQDLMQNTDLQIKALKSYSEGANFPVYKSLTPLNPLTHVSVSALITASRELTNLCLPSVVLSGGAGLVNASKDNWWRLFSPLGSNAYACADVLAEWLSIYDIARIQMAKVWKPRPQERQVDHDGHNTAQRSDDFAKSPHWLTLRKPHTTLSLPKPHGFSREDQARPAA